MFPASNSSTGNPVPQYTSSSFHSSSPFLGLNGNQILLHQYYQNQFSSHYLAKNTGFSANNIINCPNNNQDHCDNSFRSFPIKKKIKKKERCSKILTAQGPRDRRVRLSIGIARKFFDLQEMLGFDKPSKTMDWLFTNSKLAIEELTNWLTLRDHQSKISGSIPNPINSLRKNEEVKDEATNHVQIVRESRAKARARARERTIKKMWSGIENSHRSSANSQIISNLFGKKDIREMEEQFCKNKLQASEGANKETIRGSGATNIKIKPSLILGFHPNLCAPIESGTYYGSSSSNNGNCDICRNMVNPTETAAMTTVTSSPQGLHSRWRPWDSYHSSQI
ncbi:transcription factor CYCLOIDEA-like [Lycium barbarum]|uniref:transcription factor CYCLOIDEA-like n=1 Tax=Lycium barbarum TaxID=112863 RepID=UPI00293F6B62|nr:transcription factor CYCLOIDEA-like [Lycium barbarum]